MSFIFIPYNASKKEVKKFNAELKVYLKKLFITIIVCGIIIEPIFLYWMITDMQISSVLEIFGAILYSQMLLGPSILLLSMIISFIWVIVIPTKNKSNK
jgi:hypothetical protein